MRNKVTILVKLSFLTLFILFLGLYITQAYGYYEFTSNKKNVLTEKAISKFEKDLKEGKDITVTDYLEEEKNYNNNLTKASLMLSNGIEIIFNKIMNEVFNDVNNLVNDK